MAGADLPRRLAVAAVGVPLGVLVIYVGGWALVAVFALISGAAAHEFYTIATVRTGRPVGWVGIPAAGAFVVLAYLDPTFAEWAPGAMAVVVALAMVTLAASVKIRGVEGAPLSAVSATLYGAVYGGATVAFGMFLRYFPSAVGGAGAAGLERWAGPLLLILPLWVTWIGDTAAYFGGSRFGRVKLAPRVSPKKTVEGGVLGLVGSIVAGVLAGLLLAGVPALGFGPADGAVFGAVVGIVGQVGDLAESVMKREAGVKDSGALLPGHGGVLDRFDALFFALPLAYLLLLVLARP